MGQKCDGIGNIENFIIIHIACIRAVKRSSCEQKIQQCDGIGDIGQAVGIGIPTDEATTLPPALKLNHTDRVPGLCAITEVGGVDLVPGRTGGNSKGVVPPNRNDSFDGIDHRRGI